MFAPFGYRNRIRDYLLQLKYREATWVANCLCQSATKTFRYDEVLPEVLLPVPLHHSRLVDRGFNQAAEIATTWSRIFDIRLDETALARNRATPSQSGLDAKQRRQNLKQAFSYSTHLKYRHVAIVDDVVTTGATAEAITALLHDAGVEYVEIWALARTIRSKQPQNLTNTNIDLI
ncbi:MAG: ComF family protein [Pseudomonadota bacterium]